MWIAVSNHYKKFILPKNKRKEKKLKGGKRMVKHRQNNCLGINNYENKVWNHGTEE